MQQNKINSEKYCTAHIAVKEFMGEGGGEAKKNLIEEAGCSTN